MTGGRRSATLLLVGSCLLAPAAPALAEERAVRSGRDGVRPQVLQPEPAAPSAAASPGPVTSVTPAPVVGPAVPGPLAGRRDDRGLGLAVAVAVVLLLGAASLLLRLLLAVPVSAHVRSLRPAGR